jgi:hypothetical protein
MMTDTMAMFGLLATMDETTGGRDGAVVPEPEFERFALPGRRDAGVRAERLAPANTTREARTLEELGVPATLAREIEATLGALGRTRGERITGFTFRTPDGASYVLRTATAKGSAAGERAA